MVFSRVFGWPALVCAAAVLTVTSALAQDNGAQPAAKEQDGEAALHAKFLQRMNGVKLVGKFTVLGKERDKLPNEEYEIKSVAKLPQGDKWLFNARVKYGQLDVTLPMALDVVWSGDTPVITLTDATIPGLGTFSCRVLIYNGKYAGTWTHGKAGGHMFGVLEPLKDEEKSKQPQDGGDGGDGGDGPPGASGASGESGESDK